MQIDLFVTPGLGDNSYLVASAGEAVVIDPQRDAGRLLTLAESREVRIRYVLETHVHNDYLSGALEIRSAVGAEIAAPARGGYEFAHRPMSEGDEVRAGDLTLVALETPGHTPEHLSYLLQESGSEEPCGLFTGGSLMVGGAGRTDLLGPAFVDELTRAQYRSLCRVAALPAGVSLYPTHGAGSFCGAGPAPMDRTSTIGQERAQNRALAAFDEEDFVRRQLTGLLDYPAYYANMAPINRAGPRPLGDLTAPVALSANQTEARMASGAWAIDGRDRLAFARAHVPGSINVELDAGFASYVGWVVPFDAALVLILPQPSGPALDEARTQLFRVGYERIEGWLDGGVEAWEGSGRSVSTYPVADVEDLCRAYRSGSPPAVLDVRQRAEWDAGHIPGSRHVFVGDLTGRTGEAPRGEEVWVICASGHRASIAASMLDGAGLPVRLVAGGGVSDWLRGCP